MIKQNKISFAFFILFILFYSISFAQTNDENLVRNVLETQQKAWNNGDLEAFMQGYWKNDSLKFVAKSGVTYGWEKALSHYKKSYPDTSSMGKLKFTLLHLKPLSAKYYFVIGKWNLQRTAGNVEGYFTLLFQKINKQWLIIVDHTD
jgi:ketosteroid isomerase-like protein